MSEDDILFSSVVNFEDYFASGFRRTLIRFRPLNVDTPYHHLHFNLYLVLSFDKTLDVSWFLCSLGVGKNRVFYFYEMVRNNKVYLATTCFFQPRHSVFAQLSFRVWTECVKFVSS